MAKQVGPVFFTGTIDGIIFYKVGDQYYSRSKGSYKSAKHMRRNPKYKRTMEKADQFGTASKLAQELYYRHVPKAARKQGVYGQLTGMVTTLFQEGKDKEEVMEFVIAHCQTLLPPAQQKPVTAVSKEQQLTTILRKERPIVASTSLNQRAAISIKEKRARYLSSGKVNPSEKLQLSRQQKPKVCLETLPLIQASPSPLYGKMIT